MPVNSFVVQLIARVAWSTTEKPQLDGPVAEAERVARDEHVASDAPQIPTSWLRVSRCASTVALGRAVRWPNAAEVRSSHIAMKTIRMPATKPSPICWVCSALSTGSPRPPAPISEAITTIESAIMITWLRPSMIACEASGSWTLRRIWRRVEPNDSAASITSFRTERIPISVKRTSGGTA